MWDCVGQIQLVGETVSLRDFTLDDEAAVHTYASDPAVTQFTDWGPNSIEDTRAFVRAAANQGTDPPRMTFDLAVVHTASRRVVGGAALSVTNTQHHRGEIGYVIHPNFWSMGLATEAAQVLLLFGFNQLRLRRISANCHPDNHASARVLQKAGLQFEGRMRRHLFARGEWRDSLLYATTQ